MGSKRQVGILAFCYLALALPAAAQLDSAQLRAKLGSPLNRETFHMPAGFDLIVDYGTNNQVCRIEVPSLMPTTEKVARASEMKQRMQDFLAELVPASMRGKELRQFNASTGASSVVSVEYEHVYVAEVQDANPFGNGPLTLTFKNANCSGQAAK
jgi:hypothetical protein